MKYLPIALAPRYLVVLLIILLALLLLMTFLVLMHPGGVASFVQSTESILD